MESVPEVVDLADCESKLVVTLTEWVILLKPNCISWTSRLLQKISFAWSWRLYYTLHIGEFKSLNVYKRVVNTINPPAILYLTEFVKTYPQKLVLYILNYIAPKAQFWKLRLRKQPKLCLKGDKDVKRREKSIGVSPSFYFGDVLAREKRNAIRRNFQ